MVLCHPPTTDGSSDLHSCEQSKMLDKHLCTRVGLLSLQNVMCPQFVHSHYMSQLFCDLSRCPLETLCKPGLCLFSYVWSSAV